MKKLLVLPLVVLVLAGNCFAEDEPIHKMFEVMDLNKQLNGGFEAILPMIDQMALSLNLDPVAKKELIDIYRAWYEEDVDQAGIVKEIKALYVDTFTTKEIEDITKFYQTETGQKFLDKSPELMRVGMQIGMTEAQLKQPQLLERLNPFFEKYNIQ